MREPCLQFPSARSTTSSCVTACPRQGTGLLAACAGVGAVAFSPCLSVLPLPLGPFSSLLPQLSLNIGGFFFQLFAEPPLLLAFPRVPNPLRTLETYFQLLPLSRALDLVSAKLCHLTLSGSKPASSPPRGWSFPFGPLFGLITLLPGVIPPPPFRTYYSFPSSDPLPPSPRYCICFLSALHCHLLVSLTSLLPPTGIPQHRRFTN